MNDKIEINALTTVPQFIVLEELKYLGYLIDSESAEVLILRNSKFPFQRVALPKDKNISLELLKLIAQDIKISYEIFLEE